jgi:hypothetical protein
VTGIHHLDQIPAPQLAEALHEFEGGFHYPLGQDRWFSISHGDDYTRFFRAIGDARCFVAERDGRVIGVVSVSRCRLRQPEGGVLEAAYFSDLKVAESSGGRTLLRLLRDSVDWARRTPTTPGFSIVMDGTARDPTSYTGRLGIPPYVELAKLMILRIPCDGMTADGESVEAPLQEVHQRFQALTPDHYATAGGDPDIRSRIQSQGIMLSNAGACGIIEDTRRCKLLYRDDGNEMISAHLSCFGYRNAADAVSLLGSAAAWCREHGLPALFVSLPVTDSEAILKRLHCEALVKREALVQAPATVFGFGLVAGKKWSVNTAEI